MTAVAVRHTDAPQQQPAPPPLSAEQLAFARVAADLDALAETILDAEGYAINAENKADVMRVAQAAYIKVIERLMPVVERDVMMARRMGELADLAAKFELVPADGAAK